MPDTINNRLPTSTAIDFGYLHLLWISGCRSSCQHLSPPRLHPQSIHHGEPTVLFSLRPGPARFIPSRLRLLVGGQSPVCWCFQACRLSSSASCSIAPWSSSISYPTCAAFPIYSSHSHGGIPCPPSAPSPPPRLHTTNPSSAARPANAGNTSSRSRTSRPSAQSTSASRRSRTRSPLAAVSRPSCATRRAASARTSSSTRRRATPSPTSTTSTPRSGRTTPRWWSRRRATPRRA